MMGRLNEDDILSIVINSEDTTYLSHNYHPFPAKFIPGLPSFLIKNFSSPGDLVLDPFCGSGTTLVEAKLLNRDAVGIDVHPIAVLMSRVKTNPLSNGEIEDIKSLIEKVEAICSSYRHIKTSQKSLFFEQPKELEDYVKWIPKFPGRDHWFKEEVLDELAIIKSVIKEGNLSEEAQEYLLLGLSAIIVQVSNQEGETRYAAIKKNIEAGQVFDLFIKKIQDMNSRMLEFKKKASNSKISVIWGDLRSLTGIGDRKADLVVTSPPYANTYDYYLYHKLRMYWLNYDYKYVQENEIGSRDKHSSKKQGLEYYINDMRKCFEKIALWIKKDKYAVFIIGDSVISGEQIRGDKVIIELAEEAGMSLIDKVDYSQDLSSKMFNTAFRKKNKLEHVILFKS